MGSARDMWEEKTLHMFMSARAGGHPGAAALSSH